MNILSVNQPIVTSVILAILVPAGHGERLHPDRPTHGFAMNVSGTKRYFFGGGKVIDVGAGEIIYLPKHSDYSVAIPEAGDCYAINFDISESGTFEPFKVCPKHPAPILEEFRLAESVWQRKQPGYYADTLSCLYAIFGKLIKEHDRKYISGKHSALLEKITEYISKRYTDPSLRIQDIATVGGISEVWLRTLFRDVFHTSPLEYISSLRLERAKDLLSAGMYSVSEVAWNSGFGDNAYFSREFKRRVGIAPSAYALLRHKPETAIPEK